MAVIRILKRDESAPLAGQEEEQVLLEQTPGFCPEFLGYLKAELDLSGGALYFEAPSKTIYRVGFLQGTGPAELSGVEVCGLMHAGGQTLTSEIVNEDLWAFLEWIVIGAGGEWTLEDLRRTGAIYRIDGAPDQA